MNIEIPMFPLQLVAFPGEVLNLHIFEPRYKELINECEETGIQFGVPPVIENNLAGYGSLLQLEKIFHRFPNGELDISTKCVGIFKLVKFNKIMPDKLYSSAQVEVFSTDEKGDSEIYNDIYKLLIQLYQTIKIDNKLPESAASFNCFDIGHFIGLNIKQELELIEMPTEVERQMFVLNHLKEMLPILKTSRDIERKVQMNGHFKNVLPPDIKD